MRRIAERLLLAWGWQRRLIALAAGAIAALALPPLGFAPALAIGLPLLVWLTDGIEPGRSRFSLAAIIGAFSLGWWFGFGYFLAGLWWLGAAFIVDSDEFLWAMPLGVIGLPATLAVFHGFGMVAARWLWGPSIRRIFALAFGLGGAELARGVLFTGFPWNSFGMAFDASLPTLQFASVLGLEGLTVLAIVLGSAFAALGTGRSALRRIGPPVLSLAILAGITAFGWDRLNRAPDPQAKEAQVPGVACASSSRMYRSARRTEPARAKRSCAAISSFRTGDLAGGHRASVRVTHLSGRNRRSPSSSPRSPRRFQ